MRPKQSVLDDKEHRKRRRERIAILVVLLVMAAVTYVEIHFVNYGIGLPITNSMLFFGLVNVNTTLLLLLIFLVVRNLVKLVFERRRGILGSKLRTRLVVAFTSLSLIPTLLLFFLSIQFISSSIEHWFNVNVERSLQDSLDLGTATYQDMLANTQRTGQVAAARMGRAGIPWTDRERLEAFLGEEIGGSDLGLLGVYRPKDGAWVAPAAEHPWFTPARVDVSEATRDAVLSGEAQTRVISGPEGDWVMTFVPVEAGTGTEEDRGLVIAGRLIPQALVEKMEHVAQGFESYKQAIMLKNPIKVTHFITFSIITLMMLFFATWYGFYLSRELTDPIKELAEGTNRVASGDYDVQVQLQAEDEIGMLVRSFNQMASDLKKSRRDLDRTNEELNARNQEIEQRRRYMEVVLKNVAAGVISVDADWFVTMINKSAEQMLRVRAEDLLNHRVQELMVPPYEALIRELLNELNLLKSRSFERQIKVDVGSVTLALRVKVTVLKDEDGNHLGMVVVFDDLSEIEKAHRVSAWREVARRIAHEIRNPLTPIQLCAQRLQKRYGERFSEDGQVFQECTATIIGQVEQLKGLVSEFSQFARMPAATPSPNDLNKIIEETIPLYSESYKQIRFVYEPRAELPVFHLDHDQMKRVFINLLENAVNVVEPETGEIVVSTDFDPILKLARIEIADNGPGIPPENRHRLFEPYFSTTKSGTGLGLAIVSAIIQDHDGFIRVRDNEPKGTRFIIELPVRT